MGRACEDMKKECGKAGEPRCVVGGDVAGFLAEVIGLSCHGELIIRKVINLCLSKRKLFCIASITQLVECAVTTLLLDECYVESHYITRFSAEAQRWYCMALPS